MIFIILYYLMMSVSSISASNTSLPIECSVFEPKLINAIINVESGGNPKAKGDSGKSIGLMQVKFSTAQSLGYRGTKEGLHKESTNLKYGCMYLFSLYTNYEGNLYSALDAYSRGPQSIKDKPYKGKWKKHPYISKIIKRAREEV